MAFGQVPASLQYSFAMMEDYLQTMLPPLAQSVADCFVVVQNQMPESPLTELVTLSNDNNLLHMYPDGQSASGWNHEEVLVDGAPDSTVAKLVSFYQDGALYALAHYNVGQGVSSVYGMQWTAASDWAKMPFDPDLVNALGQMRQTDSFRDATGNYYIYGISQAYDPDTFVLISQGSSGDWEAVYLEQVATETTTYRILPGYGGNDLTVMTIDGSAAEFRGGSVVDGRLEWDGSTPVTQNLGQGTLSADQVFAVPSSSGDQAFLLLTDDKQLMHVVGYDSAQATATPLTGGAGQPGGVLSVSVGQAQVGLYMVFAVSTVDQRLWLLRQVASQGDGPVAFAPWVALGNQLATISCPAVMDQGPQLLFAALDTSVGMLLQQVDQGNWYNQTITSPTPATAQPVSSTTYSSEFTTVDGSGNSVSGAVVTVAADRPTVAIVNGISYHIDSTTAATVVSDASGRVTVATVSGSLISPALTISSTTMVTQAPFRSDLRSHQRLAGLDPTFPVTGASMTAAGLIPSSVSSGDADTLAMKASALGLAAVNMHPGPSDAQTAALRRLHGTGFEIDFTKSSDFVRDLSADELIGLQAGAAQLGDDLSDIWGDISNFFRNAISDLTKLSISFAQDVVYVAVTLADGVKNFVLNTLAEVGDCIEVFLQAIAAIAADVINAIKTAIEWLRSLFHWDDILLTKQVVNYYVSQCITNLTQDLATDLPHQLITAFTNAKSDVVTLFNDLESTFAQAVNFNAMVPATSSDPSSQGGPPLAGVGVNNAYIANSVQCNYVHSKVLMSSSAMAMAAGVGSAASFDPSQLLTIFEQCFPMAQLQQSWQQIQAFGQQVHSLNSFLDAVVLDLLEAIKDMVMLILSGVEAVLTTLSELAGDALQALLIMLSQPMDIPVIGGLYKMIADAPLTLLDVCSLLIAVPATLLYKILYGGDALTPPFSQADVSSITGSPISWPSYDPATGKAAPRADCAKVFSSSTLSTVLTDIFIVNMVVYSVLDISLDIQAASDANKGGEVSAALEFSMPNPTMLLGIASIVSSVLAQGFSVPYAAMSRISQGTASKADKWTIVAWTATWLPIIMDICFVAGTKNGKVTRFQGQSGPFLSTAAGTIMLSFGSVAVNAMMSDTTNYSGWDQASMLLPNFPCIFQPLVLAGTDSPPGVIAQVVLCGMDAVCDIGTGVAAGEALGN